MQQWRVLGKIAKRWKKFLGDEGLLFLVIILFLKAYDVCRNRSCGSGGKSGTRGENGMAEARYLISDAAKKVDVESHVLRYWEEELELNIPRNEMGHRYYTDFHIRLFKQIKELKEKGYQLKAIKTALAKTLDAEGESVAPTDVLEEDVMTALKECTEQEKRDLEKLDPGEAAELMNREKAEQFREFLTQMIGQAIEENNEKLSQDISRMVNDKVLKEIDYLMRVADERDEERFRQLDETIRLYQKENKGRAEAAAAKAPFLPSIFRKRKFGRNGNKL